MSQISVNNLTFGYEESFDYVFENVSFSKAILVRIAKS
jgi:hypothetical protein